MLLRAHYTPEKAAYTGGFLVSRSILGAKSFNYRLYPPFLQLHFSLWLPADFNRTLLRFFPQRPLQAGGQTSDPVRWRRIFYVRCLCTRAYEK